jgi:hypothetical protein
VGQWWERLLPRVLLVLPSLVDRVLPLDLVWPRVLPLLVTVSLGAVVPDVALPSSVLGVEVSGLFWGAA